MVKCDKIGEYDKIGQNTIHCINMQKCNKFGKSEKMPGSITANNLQNDREDWLQ